MELKEFVKSILNDVVEAVEETRKSSGRDMRLESSKDQRTVEFDIAVTVEGSTSATGKAGIKVFEVIQGGGEASQESKNATVSRVRFGVDINRFTKEEEDRFRVEQEAFNNQPRTSYE